MSPLGAIFGELLGGALLTLTVGLLAVYGALCAALLGLVLW